MPKLSGDIDCGGGTYFSVSFSVSCLTEASSVLVSRMLFSDVWYTGLNAEVGLLALSRYWSS